MKNVFSVSCKKPFCAKVPISNTKYALCDACMAFVTKDGHVLFIEMWTVQAMSGLRPSFRDRHFCTNFRNRPFPKFVAFVVTLSD